jgi:cytochrome c2
MNQIKYILSAGLILLVILMGIFLCKTFLRGDLFLKNEATNIAFNSSVNQENKDFQLELSIMETEGKALFEKNCGSCHAINKTDNYLSGFENGGRWTKRKELYNWLQNPKEYISNDTTGYTASLKNVYGVLMPSFPHLSSNDIEKILNYIVRVRR